MRACYSDHAPRFTCELTRRRLVEYENPVMNGKTLRVMLVLASVLAGAAFAAACDDTGPSPIGVHFDDAGADTSTGDDDTTEDAGEEAGDDAGDDAGEDEDAGEDSGSNDASADAEDAG